MVFIIDAQFIILYILKVINVGFAYLGLYLSERIFSEIYMKRVYALDEQPPPLSTYIWLFILFHAAFNLFILTSLMLLLFMFKTPENTFSINWYLIQTFIKDYVFMMIIFSIIAFIIAHLMQQKRYFRYRTEGLRAIRGFKEILQYCVLILFFIPYFYFLM